MTKGIFMKTKGYHVIKGQFRILCKLEILQRKKVWWRVRVKRPSVSEAL